MDLEHLFSKVKITI